MLDLAEIDRQIELYRHATPTARAIVGLQPKRADVILAGACIVRTVMDMLGCESLTVSDRGLRHGVLAERFGSSSHGPLIFAARRPVSLPELTGARRRVMTQHAELPIERLRADFAGHVIVPGDEDYDAARAVFLPAIDRRPAVIVRPADAAEVASVVAAARASSGPELAVRSGGHSAAGHGVIDGGIVLDLSALKALELDAGRRLGRGPALTAGDVTAAAAHGLASPSATPGRSASAGSRLAAASASSCASSA